MQGCKHAFIVTAGGSKRGCGVLEFLLFWVCARSCTAQDFGKACGKRGVYIPMFRLRNFPGCSYGRALATYVHTWMQVFTCLGPLRIPWRALCFKLVFPSASLQLRPNFFIQGSCLAEFRTMYFSKRPNFFFDFMTGQSVLYLPRI